MASSTLPLTESARSFSREQRWPAAPPRRRPAPRRERPTDVNDTSWAICALSLAFIVTSLAGTWYFLVTLYEAFCRAQWAYFVGPLPQGF